jgi:hypothetical protein
MPPPPTPASQIYASVGASASLMSALRALAAKCVTPRDRLRSMPTACDAGTRRVVSAAGTYYHGTMPAWLHELLSAAWPLSAQEHSGWAFGGALARRHVQQFQSNCKGCTHSITARNSRHARISCLHTHIVTPLARRRDAATDPRRSAICLLRRRHRDARARVLMFARRSCSSRRPRWPVTDPATVPDTMPSTDTSAIFFIAAQHGT